MNIAIKRIYDKPESTDGLRVLVDRLWPRGVSKQGAAVDKWARDLAPSNELRQWFSHDQSKFKTFARRYRAELAKLDEQTQQLLVWAHGRRMTLVYSAKDTQHNQAVVLQKWLAEQA